MHAAECSAAFSANLPFGLLAYMATIHELRTAGKLFPYETELDVREFRERWIDFTPSGVSWLENVLPGEVSDAGRKLSPLEQVEQIFHDYIIGRVMQYEVDRKRLVPDRDFVWEFKTPDVRVFGWLPRKRHFIVVDGGMRRDLKPYAKYAPYIQKVVSVRDGLDLDAPKYLEGVRANEIC
jgi:hypothetical protein